MPELFDDLVLYDRTRQRLREALAGRVPAGVDLEGTLDAHAYWVCTAVSQRNADWEETLREYVDIALRRAAESSAAERRELALIRSVLGEANANGPTLDIGAGWGRLAPLYDELELQAVYLERETLGARLMRRGGLSRVALGVGEAAPFADGVFSTTVIGWVLHHNHLPEVDAAGILAEAARVTVMGGTLLSVEPLWTEFEGEKWIGLLTGVGFTVNSVEVFHQTETSRDGIEYHALAIGTRRPS